MALVIPPDPDSPDGLMGMGNLLSWVVSVPLLLLVGTKRLGVARGAAARLYFLSTCISCWYSSG
jgi:hypothetical protein